MFSRLKVSWNHFGQKHSLRINDYELEHTNLYDALMKKVHEIRPDFEGAIAYIDQYGREVIVNNDKDLRVAIDQSKEKLKLHTALTYGKVISAAELAGKPVRSHSVPPSMVVYPGYGYKYNSYAPYSQNLVFGMPTHNAVLLSPFPFGGHYRTSFIGPNKYHHFGGWSGHKYYSPGWGPVW